jgi:very-short-patch-repair endonuclease
MSKLEEALAVHIRAAKLPEPQREYRFAALATGGTGPGVRQRVKAAGLHDWRMDFAWPDLMLAVEVEGGAWVGGRHTRGEGFLADLRKYEAAQRMGWTIYRTAGELIKSGNALATIEQLIKAKRMAA